MIISMTTMVMWIVNTCFSASDIAKAKSSSQDVFVRDSFYCELKILVCVCALKKLLHLEVGFDKGSELEIMSCFLGYNVVWTCGR